MAADGRRVGKFTPMSSHDATADYTIASPDEARDPYANSDVPGEFRSMTALLGTDQLALSCVRVPPHSDFDQSTGHYHDQLEEVYLLVRGTLTMRFGDDIRQVSAPAAVRVAPRTARAVYRNEGDEPAEVWAISQKRGNGDATKIDDFWEASEQAAQHR